MATIKLKNSGTPGAVPGSLIAGELAINLADGALYYANSGGGSPQRISDAGSRIEQYRVAKVFRGYTDIRNNATWISGYSIAETTEGYCAFTSSSTSPSFWLPVALAGLKNRYVAVRYKRVSGSHNAYIYYTTAGHGESASYYAKVPSSPTGTWQTAVVDMHALVAGGTDWRDNTILSIGLSLNATNGGVTQVAWIAILEDSFGITSEEIGGKASVQDPPTHYIRQEHLTHVARPIEVAKLGLGAAQSIPNNTSTSAQMASVEIDTFGGTTDTVGNPSYAIVVPTDADMIRITGFVTFAASSAGTSRILQLYSSPAATAGPYTLVRQIQVPPQGGGYTTTVFVHEVLQVNGPAQARISYVMNVQQDSGGALNLLAGGTYMSVEVLSRKASFAPEAWLRTIQGLTAVNERTSLPETRNWAHIYANQFSSNYKNMVAALAGFSVLNLGSVVGWGNNHPKYPFAKHHANWSNYPHTSGDFNIAGKTWQDFLTDIRLINPQIKIFIYSTPAYDDLRAWNATNGTQTAGTDWSAGGTIANSPGNWENFITTLDAMTDSRERLIDGVYLDLMGDTNISSVNRDNALSIVKKRYGLSVMCNILGADLDNAKFICSSPYIGYGDYVYSEGFKYDSTNGDTTANSTAVIAYMAKQAGRGVRFAGVIEELFGTTNTEMGTNGYNNAYTHWIDGYNLFGTYRQPGWLIEHQRAYYDYVGSAGNA